MQYNRGACHYPDFFFNNSLNGRGILLALPSGIASTIVFHKERYPAGRPAMLHLQIEGEAEEEHLAAQSKGG